MTTYYDQSGTGALGAVQFENANEGRSYPFADDAELTSEDGRTLGNDVVADMHVVVPSGTDVYVSSVRVSAALTSICVHVAKEGRLVAALACTRETGRLSPYVPYVMEKLHGSEDVGGMVTFGAMDVSAAAGTYRFAPGAASLAESAVSRYVPSRLRRLVDPRTGESVSGNVRVDFSAYVDATRDGDGVRLDLQPGAAEALLSRCDREIPVNPCGATPVETLNGVRPDDRGRIVIWFH